MLGYEPRIALIGFWHSNFRRFEASVRLTNRGRTPPIHPAPR